MSTYSIQIYEDGVWAGQGEYVEHEQGGEITCPANLGGERDADRQDVIYSTLEDVIFESENLEGEIEIEGRLYSWELAVIEETA